MKNLPTYNVLASNPTGQVITIELVVDNSQGFADLEEEITDLISQNLDCDVFGCEVTNHFFVTNSPKELNQISRERAFKK